MSEQEVTKLIKLNMDNYPGRFLPNASKEQVKTLAATWWQLFKDLPAETVMNAYLKALTVCEFPVTVADIFSELRKVGYDGVISIEHEDGLMSTREGLEKAIEVLKRTIIFEEREGDMYWA